MLAAGGIELPSYILLNISNFLPQPHRIIKRRHNERPWHGGGFELLYPGSGADLQRKDTSGNLLAYCHSWNLARNRRVVWMGLSPSFGFHRLPIREKASELNAAKTVEVTSPLITFQAAQYLQSIHLVACCLR